ncbi:MAG: tetratricopeptide repeat protein, partial [Acidobacteriota bacterium]
DEGLRRVLELMPEHAPSRLTLAERAAQDGESAVAAAEFEEVLRLDPSNAKARVGLATLALQDGEPQLALEHIQEALARQPAAAPLHYQAALIQRQLGDLEAAQRHLARVPSQNATQVHLVSSDPWMNDIDQLRIGARHHDQRAMRHLAAGRYELAIVELRQALAANPERIYARHGLGAAMDQLGRREEALVELRSLVDQAPNHVPSLVLMAEILQGMGRSDEAEALIDQALAHDPEDQGALRMRARL